jgi:hypothetical protein
MKKIILFLIVLVTLSCATTKSVFDTVENKKSLGKVISVKYTSQGFGYKSTYVITELEQFFISEKVKISEGTELFIYSNSDGTDIYVIWENAKKGYLIK